MFSLTMKIMMTMSDLRLYISVKDAVSVHVLDSFQKLVDVVLHSLLRQVVRASFDGFVEVHLHEFED